MRKMEKTIICVLFLCILLLIIPGISVSGDTVAERPTYSAGDYWIVKNHNGKETKIEFLREEEDKYIFRKMKYGSGKKGKELITDFNLTDVERIKSSYRHFPGPIIKFPLTIGKKWSYEYDRKRSVGPLVQRLLAKFEVEAFEPITVPAGTFQAFKITAKLEAKKRRKITMPDWYYFWYAPEVKYIVKWEKRKPAQNLVKSWELKNYKIK